MNAIPRTFSALLPEFSTRTHDTGRPTMAQRAARVCALCACALLAACEGASVDLVSADPDLAELAQRVEALEAEQQAQADELAEAREALAECLNVSENAAANAEAAQERSNVLEQAWEEEQLPARVADLEDLTAAILTWIEHGG